MADTGLGMPCANANVQMRAGTPFYLRVDYTNSKLAIPRAICH